MSTIRKLSLIVFLLCLIISFKYPNAGSNSTKRSTSSSDSIESSSLLSGHEFPYKAFIHDDILFSIGEDRSENVGPTRSLEYDFYRQSCPKAERTVREMVQFLFTVKSSMVPALLRLVFHDCFIEGCDASVLLDPAEGIESEKDSPPNETLKGFDVIDIIKSDLEELCPGVVSCADILVLAAREAVLLAGGPFYPLYTGRRDSTVAFPEKATYELPSPHDDLSETLASFSSRGFDERETVSLLGAHSIGVIHCPFFHHRLYNFAGTNQPDPSLDSSFLEEMRSMCNRSHTSSSSAPFPSFSSHAPSLSGPPSLSSAPFPSVSSPAPSFSGSPSPSSAPFPSVSSPAPSFSGSPSPSSAPFSPLSGSPSSFIDLSQFASEKDEAGVDMAYEGPGSTFGMLYYRSLMQGKGILYADQQLTAGEETGTWVRAYASDNNLFRRDFALVMMKLSNLNVLTSPMGQVRLNCSKVA
ncbi:hypothetical protein ACFE04_003761 [Oxalis oulophora]